MKQRSHRPSRKRRRSGEPEGLTPRQFAVLQFVQDYQRQKGYSPTMQELADHFDVSKVTIFEHLGSLEKKGWLSRAKYRARSLRIDPGVELPQPQGEPGLPLVGSIAAGRPIEAIQDDSRVDLNDMFPAKNNTFVLRVRGDSMIDEHIADGDLVVIQPTGQPHDGQTVVALLDSGEATLKKFYREGGRVRLQPANPNYPPIYADRVNVQGVVVGVIRKFKD
jgi:repressor LexA